MSATFKSLGLSPETLGAVKRARFGTPTPIQAQAIPPALSGRDVIGCAATGTGKTAAYLLPMIERFAGERGTLGLILAPTRELVQQVAEQARFFGEPRRVLPITIIGGEDMNAQVAELKERPTLIVATPGRLVDLLGIKAVNLSHIRTLVLDEADRMLDMGFLPQINQILQALPRKHQTLLFSATLGADVARFGQRALNKPVRVEVTPSGTPAARAEQHLYMVKPEEKWPLLLTLLAEDQASALVFVRTQARADKMKELLAAAGHKSAALHAGRTQAQRKQALEGFRRGQYRCLVATDLAARGLDVDDIGHVISLDIPHGPEDYVHRIGRTARAEASGRASLFALDVERRTLRDIESIIRQELPLADVPRKNPIFRKEMEAFLAKQRDPGPPQAGHGRSTRAPDATPGRHARSHGKARPKGPDRQ
ncbi:DEAD/DEAH box helicase [Corallococcus sp. ZKHCc1 1396]|uniref:DEAD/DEAH box helicase n=1 Tax=Corallococcus soli TaxID=2710757 RepID=A0ABR9PMX7_9BACT|nr:MULTISPECIES: DEAD/DEAH box helicase [Corallococcus]MBE4749278.1 DEAD/DEAH box helicase [Corallococcus soli]MCY1034884.1 DEAD/DEAH box helicase [Corallococcus sp. BB11-1]